ncbi:hypothetical protein Tco_0169577 [Tanacetum coccineum]
MACTRGQCKFQENVVTNNFVQIAFRHDLLHSRSSFVHDYASLILDFCRSENGTGQHVLSPVEVTGFDATLSLIQIRTLHKKVMLDGSLSTFHVGTAVPIKREYWLPSGNVRSLLKAAIRPESRDLHELCYGRSSPNFLPLITFQIKNGLVSDDIEGVTFICLDSFNFQKIGNNKTTTRLENASEVVLGTYFGDNGVVTRVSSSYTWLFMKPESDRPLNTAGVQQWAFLWEGCTKDMEKILELKFVWTWIPIQSELLIISVSDPQSVSSKRYVMESYLDSLINSWNGVKLIMGVSTKFDVIEDRDFPLIFWLSVWIVTLRPQAYFTQGSLFVFGLLPFCFYHSWLELPGFDDLVSKFWNSFTLDDSNGMIRFKKKLQMLKKEIRAWTLDFKRHQEVLKHLHDVNLLQQCYIAKRRKKFRWAIEGDENSKYFHVINLQKRANKSSQLRRSRFNALIGHVLSACCFQRLEIHHNRLTPFKVKRCPISFLIEKIRVGKCYRYKLWKELWMAVNLSQLSFPRCLLLKRIKDISGC